MKNKFKIIIYVIIITSLILVSACEKKPEPLSIGFWNVENLFDLQDDPMTNDEEFALGGKKNITREIYDLKLKNCAEVLSDLDADIVGLCEIENRFMLEELNSVYAGRDYEIIHFDSPDERGIDNALFYDPEKFEVTDTRAIQNKLPNGDHTRDILLVTGKYAGKILHIFVNHWPSNYGGKATALPKRAATAGLIVEEVRKILAKDMSAEIVLLGDFNEDPTDEHVRSLRAVGLSSLMEPLMGQPKVGTYVYRGTDYFYDQIIVSDGLQNPIGLSVINESLMILDKPKYRQQKGEYIHFPFRFWAGNNLLGGYSDHLAVKVKITAK